MQNDSIEILDRDKKTKATYILSKEEHLEGYKEKTEYNSWLEVVFALVIKICRFSLYLVINLLKMLIKAIEGLFLRDYEPFKPISDVYKEKQDKKVEDYIKRNTKLHAVTSHNYEFIRSKVFARNYLKIDKLLSACACLSASVMIISILFIMSLYRSSFISASCFAQLESNLSIFR